MRQTACVLCCRHLGSNSMYPHNVPKCRKVSQYNVFTMCVCAKDHTCMHYVLQVFTETLATSFMAVQDRRCTDLAHAGKSFQLHWYIGNVTNYSDCTLQDSRPPH